MTLGYICTELVSIKKFLVFVVSSFFFLDNSLLFHLTSCFIYLFRVHLSLAAQFALSQSSTIKFSLMHSGTAESKPKFWPTNITCTQTYLTCLLGEWARSLIYFSYVFLWPRKFLYSHLVLWNESIMLLESVKCFNASKHNQTSPILVTWSLMFSVFGILCFKSTIWEVFSNVCVVVLLSTVP